MFIENNLLKFEDIVESSQLKLIFDFNNGFLPDDIYNLFTFTKDIHGYNSHIVKSGGMFIPQIRTCNFGNKSLTYAAPVTWNNFLKINPEIGNLKTKFQLKKDLKEIYQKKYKAL